MKKTTPHAITVKELIEALQAESKTGNEPVMFAQGFADPDLVVLSVYRVRESKKSVVYVDIGRLES